jgi:RNA polymerase sigma factor (sigma-70 family)
MAMFTHSQKNHIVTRREFDDMVRKLKKGDNSPLVLVQQYQRDCIGMLIKKSAYSCNDDVAYDIFIDSILDFRANVLMRKVEYQNIKAYLKRICWNKWLAASRHKVRVKGKEHNVARYIYSNPRNNEVSEEAANIRARRLSAINKSLQTMNERCRQILQMAIIDRLSMSEIATHFNFASANVAKTTKSRCYKKLLSLIRNEQVI